MALAQQDDKPQTIALCMIVKDEAEVILRCLNSVSSFVDHYIICDTGSTDGTQEKLRKHFKENKLKGVVYDRPWVNFAHNRQEAFDYGKGKADYIMTLDADEVFAPLTDGRPDLTKKVNGLSKFTCQRVDVKTHYGPVIYSRPQFFKNDIKWLWESPVHEYCYSNEQTTPVQAMKDVCVYPTRDGARAKDGKRYAKDATIFERELIDKPEDSRLWFYLAQSYQDSGTPLKALEPLKKCISISPWEEEKAVAYLRMGRIFMGIAKFGKAIECFWKSYNCTPDRAEGLYEVVRHYRRNEMYTAGAALADIALKCTGKNTLLFIERDIYDYKLKDEASICYYYTRRHGEVEELVTELLANPHISSRDLERIGENKKNNDTSLGKISNIK